MLWLSAMVSLVGWPAHAQAPDALKDRQERVLAMVLEAGSAAFDPQANLVKDVTGLSAITEGSLEYAAALLMSGLMPERAAALVDAVLACQAQTGKASVRGAFPRHPGEAVAEASFTAGMAPWLAHLHRSLGDRLPSETRSRLAASLGPALGAVSAIKVEPGATALYLTRLAAVATLSEAIGEGERTTWRTDVLRWAAFTEKNGLPSAGSPGLRTAETAALQWLWLAASDEATKSRLAAALEYLYRDLALRYHPKAGMVGGAFPRASSRDCVGMGASRYLLYTQFGQPDLPSAPPYALFLALPGFVPNAETLSTAATLDVPRLLRARTVDWETTAYLHSQFSLGTMTGPVTGETAPVVMTYPSREQPSAYCRVRPAPARVSAVQQDAKALVSFDFDRIGLSDRRQVEVDFRLGLQPELTRVWINQSPFYEAGSRSPAITYPVAISQQTSVVTERGGVFTAITIVTAGPAAPKATDAGGKPGTLEWAPNAEGVLELTLRAFARQERTAQMPRDNYRLVLAVEMAATDTYRTMEEFAAAVVGARSRKELTARNVKVGERTDNPHRPPEFMKPVERGNWIFELRVVQELQYQSGNDLLALTEDLERNQVVLQAIDGAELPRDFLYRSPSLNQMPGDPLDSVFRAPPPPPAPPEPAPAPAAEGGKEQ